MSSHEIFANSISFFHIDSNYMKENKEGCLAEIFGKSILPEF